MQHRRSVTGSAPEGSTERALVQKSASLHDAAAAAAPAHTSRAVPSRFRAEAEAQYATAHPNILSDDQIVCQSKLYDAFELQELEQHLDRKLNFHNDRNSRSFSSLNYGQASLNSQKSLLSVSNLLIDRPSPADHRRDHASCTCNFCNTDAKVAINVSGLPTCEEWLTTASNILTEPVHLQAEVGRCSSGHLQAEAGRCSGNQSRADMNDPLQEENYASYARRSYSMPRSHYHGPARSAAHLDAEQEALQDLQVRADEYAISSTANLLKAHKRSRAERSRWSLVNWLFRSHKKQDNMPIMQQDAASTSTSMNFSEYLQNKEYHHHHNIVHYHHVHHHHHHHVTNGVHFEEIDWPLSPARLQELGWLMSKSCTQTEDF